MRVLPALFIAILTAQLAPAQQFTTSMLARQPLTNESIVTLAKAGFDELFILQLIRTSRTRFDTSVDGLVKMKEAGVSEDLIRLMAMPLVPQPAVAAGTSPAPIPVPKKKGPLVWLHLSK